jgi:type I restriction modification DNA specificity protein
MHSLKAISSIHLGYHFRGRILSEPTGAYRVVQIRDLSVGETYGFESLMKIERPQGLKNEQLLLKGDVLVVGRGDRRLAVALDFMPPSPTIAGSQFYIVRPNENIDSEYLAWYINQKYAQRYLEERSVGSNVKIISKEAISALQIVLPDLATQKKIARLHSLNVRQKILFQQIAEKRYVMTERSMIRSLQQPQQTTKGPNTNE